MKTDLKNIQQPTFNIQHSRRWRLERNGMFGQSNQNSFGAVEAGRARRSARAAGWNENILVHGGARGATRPTLRLVKSECSVFVGIRHICCWRLEVLQFAAVFLAAVFILAGCSKTADKPADAPEKAGAKPGVTLDAETQARIGLEIASPVPAQRQPELHAMGRVVDPLVFTQAAADYEMARAAAAVSQSDFQRTKKLAAQDNASPRVVEAAQAAAARDALALNSARAKFTAEWGVHLAAQTNLLAFAENLQTNETALVKLSLTSGVFLRPLPTSALLLGCDSETKLAIAAEFADDCGIDPATQAQTLLFLVKQKMPPSLAVVGHLKTPGEPVSGVLIPASAVLRHAGKGWVYVQTETNQFARVEISLDGLTDGGWFVRENLSATNRVVVISGQTILSAELGGAMNTGAHD